MDYLCHLVNASTERSSLDLYVYATSYPFSDFSESGPRITGHVYNMNGLRKFIHNTVVTDYYTFIPRACVIATIIILWDRDSPGRAQMK